MAKFSFKVASTSQTINIFVQDSSSTIGAGLTGLLFNTASLTAYYALPRAAAVSITLATLAAVTSAYSSGGFKEIDATNMPGWYRLDLPNAALASGRFVSVELRGATNMAPCCLEIELTGWDNQDATAGGLSNLDAAISSRMATFFLPTNFTSLSIDGSGRIDVGKWLGTAVTAATTAGKPDVVVVTNNDKTGYTASTVSDKTGYSLTQTFPTNFATLAITVGGAVTVGTNNDKTGYTASTVGDKTGYSLTQAFPANFSSLSIDASGRVTLVPGQIVVKKNTGLNNFGFVLISSLDDITPATGITVTAQRSIDGAAFGACANAVAEVGNGLYVINLAAADLNGASITFRFTGAGALARLVTVYTQP